MNDTAIRVRGLRKTYGNTTAVAGLDLDVHRGETVLAPKFSPDSVGTRCGPPVR